MKQSMRMSVAFGAMAAVKAGGQNNDLSQLGMTPTEQEKLTGNEIWLGEDRTNMVRCLEATIYHTADAMGLPRFDVPAEWLAAHIYMYVNPRNYFQACSWMQRGASVDSEDPKEAVTPYKLFRYLVMLCDDANGEEFVHRFEKSVRKKVLDAEKSADK
mgnify:CR=1 FL=1